MTGGAAVSLDEAQAAWRDRADEQGPVPRHRPDTVDDDTLRAAVAGDRCAFESIVTAYEPRLRILAHQLLRDRFDVDDVLQDVFLRAYRGLHKFRGDAALGTWLHRITYTSCLSLLRKRRVEAASLDTVEAVAGTQRVDDDVLVRLRLERALATLDPEHLVAVLMVDRDGYDYATVAGVLGIPVGTVGSRLNAARQRLRGELGLQGDDDRSSDPDRREEGR